MIVSRLKQIIEKKGLTPSKFAQAIQVQPSSISHILNGRNKPSLDLILKIHDAFPDVDITWLITGKPSVSNPRPLPASPSADHEILSGRVRSKKKIDRMVIFYEDGSFDHYQN